MPEKLLTVAWRFRARSVAAWAPMPKADDGDDMHPLAIAALFSIPFVAIVVGFAVYVVVSILTYGM